MESPGNLELPRAFEDADIDHLVILIADMLERLMTHNDQIPLSPESLTRFHSRSPPGISVLEYLRRIVKYANVEKSCLLITLHYIDQICARLPHFTLSSLTCHRFVIASIVVSTKALCDAFCTNNHYAKIGGVRVAELNVLEKEFLAHIDWRLTCTREVLDAYYVNLIRTHSSGGYTLGRSASPISSEGSDMETEQPTSPRMNDSSVDMPDPTAMEARSHVEPSTVLIDRATLSPRMTSGPTIEQNMAFAALQQPSSSRSTLITPTDQSTLHGTLATQPGSLVSTHTSNGIHRPTIEQNIAFAEIQQPLTSNGTSIANPSNNIGRSRLSIVTADDGHTEKRQMEDPVDSTRPRTRPRINDEPG